MEAFVAGFTALGDISLLMLLVCATLGGVVIGALPGLNATTGAALLLPFTLTMEPVAAISVLTAIYCSATFAGAITAILINTPGTSASATTCLDGNPMAVRGEAGRALGLAVISSTVGGVFSVAVLMLSAPILARAAYNFAPPEYFALTLFGLSMLVSVGGGSPIRNLIAGAFGILLATVGTDLLTSVKRFTFDVTELRDGIGFVPVMIGVFGISELLAQASKLNERREQITMKAIKLPSREDYKRVWKTILRSSGIGTFIGILPAEGATVASMIGYNEAKRWSKTPEEFGKGARRNRRIRSSQQFCNRRCNGAHFGLGHSRIAHCGGDPGGIIGAWLAPRTHDVHRAGAFCLCDFLVDAVRQSSFFGNRALRGPCICPRHTDPNSGAMAKRFHVLCGGGLCAGSIHV